MWPPDRHRPGKALLAGVTRHGSTILLIGIALFLFSTTRAGTIWGDDWAMYVHHARNILEGKAYDDTGFIYNPAAPTYAPRTYPPGFPLLLVPWYAVFGLDLFWLKLPAIACFVLALVVVARYYRHDLSLPVLLLLIASLGMNPFLWHFKDFILSDFPFLLFVMVTALRIDRTPVDGRPALHVTTGLSVYCAYAIRPLGALFIPALVLFDLVGRRTITRRLVIMVSTFAALALVQALIFPRDASYLEMIGTRYAHLGVREMWADVTLRVAQYRAASSGLWMFGAPSARPGGVFSGVFFALASVGLIRKLLRRPSPVDVFVILYLVALSIFPGFQGPRYLIPALPLIFFYVFSLTDLLAWRSARAVALASLLVPMSLLYLSSYRAADWVRIPHGIQEEAAQDLFTFIRDRTPADAVIVCAKPRALSLYTGRASALYHEPPDPADLLAYLKGIRAGYAVTGTIDGGPYFSRLVDRDPVHFHKIYSNEEFNVFETRLGAMSQAGN